MVVDHDHLRQQHDQEWTAQQIAENLVTQRETEIQHLQTRNQETTAESNTYQDGITAVQNEVGHECANVEALWTIAAAAGAAPE
jgi:methanogenic corrinoid protein MtbC1